MLTNILIGLWLTTLVLLVLGFISPKISLFWLRGKRTRLKSFGIYILLFCVFFCLTLVVNYNFSFYFKYDPKKNMSVKELNEKFENNLHKYTEVYGGKPLLVSGRVLSIFPDKVDGGYILEMGDLTDTSEFIQCQFTDTLMKKKVKIGDKISFNAYYISAENDFTLNLLYNCKLLKQL